MVQIPPIPPVPITGPDGKVSREWWVWFHGVFRSFAEITASVVTIETALLPSDPPPQPATPQSLPADPIPSVDQTPAIPHDPITADPLALAMLSAVASDSFTLGTTIINLAGTTLAVDGLTALGFGLSSNVRLVPSAAAVGLDDKGAGIALTSTTAGAFFGLSVQPGAGLAGEGFIEIDGIGTGNEPFLDLHQANGVVGALTATVLNDLIGGIYYNGYDGTTEQPAALAIEVVATQNWTALAHGTGFKISATKTGTVAAVPLIDYDISHAGVLTFGEAVALPSLTFASLPSPALGMLATVSDGSTNVWGAVLAGGGANKVLAFYNGTNWTVAGK